MSKFNQKTVRPAAISPILTDPTPTGLTYEGAPGYARDAKGELFLLAVANMVGERTFYEKAGDRDARYEALIAQVAVEDPAWTAGFLGWLRAEGNMRSASLVGAAEAARAMVKAKIPGSRQVVASVLQRADEPGEVLAYWMSRYGRALPMPVKRGVADAARRLYSERALLKYDTASHGFRFADVLELCHPASAAPWQGELFSYALARRHNRDQEVPELLTMIRNNVQFRRIADEHPEALLSTSSLKAAGMTWEDALSLAGSKVDKARLWEALIPSMGIMALARNLRNFDQAGVSDEVAGQVCARFADPEQVAQSRMFPFRWLAAYRNAPSLRWGHALDKALTASLANVPELAGTSLILVDISGSMADKAGGSNSDMTRADVAKVFGAALALRAKDSTLAWFNTGTASVPVRKGDSLLKLVERMPVPGGGTATAQAVLHWSRAISYDRVIVITDEQAGYDHTDPFTYVSASAPTYTWNLAGYQLGHASSGVGNRHVFGGLSDAVFKLIPLLEARQRAAWPWG